MLFTSVNFRMSANANLVNDGGKRRRSGWSGDEIDEEDVQVTPPSSPTRFSLSQSEGK